MDDHKTDINDQAICFLCDVLTSSDDTPFTQLLPEESPDGQILLRTSSMAAIIDVAPMGFGHCLLVPQRHCLSVSQLTTGELSELLSLKTYFEFVIIQEFGHEAVAFEHGQCMPAADEALDHCGIDHAHLHLLVGSSSDFEDIRTKSTFDRLDGLADLKSHVGTSPSYLYFETPIDGSQISVDRGNQSQALRRSIAANRSSSEELAVPWNWHDQIVLAPSFDTGQRVMRSLRLYRERIAADFGSEHFSSIKLIRSRVLPSTDEGRPRATVRDAQDFEYYELLRAKLLEEVDEFMSSGEVSELGDILEVLASLADIHGLSLSDVADIAKAKRLERGGFDGGKVLLS